MGEKNSRKLSSLKSGRPPTAKRPPTSLSSKATRTTIRTFHQLNKQLDRATETNDHETLIETQARINALGGLEAYQAASIQGQSVTRGGDSSVQLMQWLEPFMSSLRSAEPKYTLLEVGALSMENACSKAGVFSMTRVDLRSSSPGITTQDFMLRPRPVDDAERFDVVSLSLVLNFVPDSVARGEMLRRVGEFLRMREDSDVGSLLFLVLPAPCVVNSRYCSDERLTCLLASLGFTMMQRRQTAKLVYYLWQRRDQPLPAAEQDYPKVLLSSKAKMNNFAVLLRPPEA